MTILLTASNDKYRSARDFNAFCGRYFGGFDKVVTYRIETVIDEEFRKRNRKILANNKGFGFWLWKPYCILKALNEECADGDVLFYLDAAAFVYRNMSSYLRNMEQDIYAVELPYIEEEFTKREVFCALNMREDIYEKTRQFQASYMAFRKTDTTVRFVKEWLGLCQNYDLISPEFDNTNQIRSFYEHRMDQSLFSVLCKKYGVRSGSEITQFRKWGYPYIPGVSYNPVCVKSADPQSVFLHRRADVPRIGGCLRAIIIYFSYYKRRKLIPLTPLMENTVT